jgi:hypothetical protein
MYFAVPKAACTQMKELLRTVESAPPVRLFADGARQTRRDMFIHARSNVPLPSLADLDDRAQREVLEAPDFLRMTVVRNPYTRLVSAWRNKIFLCEPQTIHLYLQIKGGLPGVHEKSLVSFEEFVEYLESKCDLSTCDAHWRWQINHTFLRAMRFSLIVKVEQMTDGLRQFQQHLGLSDYLPANGRNASVPFGSSPYSKELADRVYSLYRRDFEVLGYDRNTWPAGRENGSEQLGKACVTEERLCDEIIERNLIIADLYEERERLQAQLNAQLRRLSRLHLLSIIDGLVAFRSMWRKVARDLKG